MSTLSAVDKILVLADGAVATFGPRDEVFKSMQAQAGAAAARRAPPAIGSSVVTMKPGPSGA
jgi:ABC-type protease/lipase transport system fused ATPase/permease subunit